MNNLTFPDEKTNIGGLASFKFIYEKDLSKDIEIVNGQALGLMSNVDFNIVEFVQESASFSEKFDDIDTYVYEYKCLLAHNEYKKHGDVILLDNNKIIAVIKDNNGESRLLGNKSNACLVRIESKIDEKVSSLNSYEFTLKWTSRYRAAFANDIYIQTNHYQFEDGVFYDFND